MNRLLFLTTMVVLAVFSACESIEWAEDKDYGSLSRKDYLEMEKISDAAYFNDKLWPIKPDGPYFERDWARDHKGWCLDKSIPADKCKAMVHEFLVTQERRNQRRLQREKQQGVAATFPCLRVASVSEAGLLRPAQSG